MPKNARRDGRKGFGDCMVESIEPRDATHMVGILESLLDELDSHNLIQTAAKVASTIDTLKAEIERKMHKASVECQSVELIRAIEHD